ncbi:MAG: aminopeptidase [Lachnospiraceae bacterium]|nr:aminopeptidase [Lachnospiraceae bacterium]
MSFYGMKEEQIREYARLVVRTGVNVQQGQYVVVNCPAEHYEFGRLVIEEAYEAGAKEVVMRWGDSVEMRQYYLHASDETLAEFPQWKADSLNYYSRQGAGWISIGGSDPEALKGVNPMKMRIRQAASEKATEEHSKRLMASEIPWTVAAVPQKQWAKKVFPDLPEEEAMASLWKLILQAVRIGNGDAVAAWADHDSFLKKKCKMLNDHAFVKLHYENSIGTDFTVGLVRGHIWEGGSETAGTGTVFEANMPTEEIFTMPDCRVAEGTLVSALPLSYRGNLIRNFRLTFHEGQVVDYSAEEGYETLKSLIDTDEGSKRLGEVALVPYSSPISQMKTLFYNTLFDENASCHFALGECYPTTIRGGAKMSEEELKAAGGNATSMNHVDFMVGTADLKITGIHEDGSEVVLFENGDWAGV